MIGTRWPGSSCARIARVAAKPSMRGIRQSIRTAAKPWPAVRVATASTPSAATSASKPAFSSMPTATIWLTWLSSTTRIRRFALPDGRGCRTGWTAPSTSPAAAAKRAEKRNVLPRPGSLSTVIRPPMALTSWRAMVRPRPVPPCRRVVEGSAWVKASKSRCWASRGMPGPVSATETSSSVWPGPWASTVTAIRTSPLSVNFTALDPRLAITWPSRVESPRRNAGTSGATSTGQREPLLVGQAGEQRHRLLEHRPDAEVHDLELQLAGLDLGEVEDVVDDRAQRGPGTVERPGQGPLLLVELGAHQEVGEAQHAVHRGPDLVAHRRQELRLHLRGLHGLVAGLGQLGRRALPLGHAAQHGRDLLDEVAGVLVGRHLVGEHHHHAGHAGAVPDRDGDQAVGRLVAGHRAYDDLAGPVALGRQQRVGDDAVGRPVAGEHERHQLGVVALGEERAERVPARRPADGLRGAQQGLDQPGGLVGHHRDLPQQRQPPGGLADLVVGEHLVGDVLVGAGHPHRPAGGVALGAAEATQPADGAVAPDDPGVPLELVGAGVRRVHLPPDVGPVVGVDVVEEPLVGGGELLAGDLVDPVELVGPHDLVVLDVPLPAADGGDRLRLGQPLLAVAQRVEQLPALGVVGVAVEVAEDVAGVVAYRPPARQQPDRLAVGAQVHGLEVVVAGVAGARHGHVGGELLLAGGVVDVVGRQPGHLLGGPAQQLGHPLVGPQRAALAVQQPDAVGAGLDQVPEQPRVRAHGHHHRLCARLPQRLRGAGRHRTPQGRTRRGAALRLLRWPGAGSNRRPIDFQSIARTN